LCMGESMILRKIKFDHPLHQNLHTDYPSAAIDLSGAEAMKLLLVSVVIWRLIRN
jgi:hypothetical protein